MSALTLRIIASICMLLDHIGYFYHIAIFRVIGRLAFPLYVFLMVNGFRHTKNRLRYALRLAIFAIISQIPFTLLSYPRLPLIGILKFRSDLLIENFNVFVTLLLGLIAVWSGEAIRKKNRYLCLLPAFAIFCAYSFGLISSDYGTKGILLAVVFWLFDGKHRLMTIGAFLAVFHGYFIRIALAFVRGQAFFLPSDWERVQIISLLSLLLIACYNGKAGNLPQNRIAKKSIQLGFYAFYPAHILLLWLLAH